MKNKLLLSLALFCSSVWAETTDLFPQAQVEKQVSQAFDTMSTRYTAYATMFNGCQGDVKPAECGEPFQKLQSEYIVAKSIYESMNMMQHPQFKTLEAPILAMQDLSSDLVLLGYLETRQSGVQLEDPAQVQTLVTALNKWLVKHEFPETDKVYLLHTQMVAADRLSRIEK